MKNKIILLYFLLIISANLKSQNFPEGSNAIHKDSAIIVAWAKSVEVFRGYIKITDTTQTYTEGDITSNKVWFGEASNAIGKSNGEFVSFGDGGYAIVQFDFPIQNKPGPDFAIFENAMFSPPNQSILNFVELAFVEVSSDGVNYERFPTTSNMQTNTQINSFESVDRTLYHNFAGVYPVFYGVPFDLDDISDEVVDKNNITHIKIIDAVGCINPDFASYDSQGNIVNFAWPTPFWQGGFDLDAVAVINSVNTIENYKNNNISIYPNPVKDYLYIDNQSNANTSLFLYDLQGKIIKEDINDSKINLSDIPKGVYFLKIHSNKEIITKKLIKID